MSDTILELIKEKKYDAAFLKLKEKKYAYVEFIEADYINEQNLKARGMLTEEEWQHYENDILNQRLLKIVLNNEYEPPLIPKGQPKYPPDEKQPRLLIIYSGTDKHYAKKVFHRFSENRFLARIDDDHKSSLEFVADFWKREFREADYIILLISVSALSSGWVGTEIDYSVVKEKMDSQKLIPLSVDGGRFNSDKNYYSEVITAIENNIDNLNKEIDKITTDRAENNHLRNKLDRMLSWKVRVREFFSYLESRGVMLSISGADFDQTMNKVCNDISGDFKNKK